MSTQPSWFKIAGVALAITSSLCIGSSFVLKKQGLMRSQVKHASVPGEGHGYLRSWLWWSGLVTMAIGEILNVVAYSFASAALVTPLGAISVVVSAVLSSIFLKETLTFFGKLGVVLCLLGAVIVGLNAPEEGLPSQINQFRSLFIAPGFLAYTGVVVIASLVLIFYVAPRYGKTHMLVYVSICSLIGGISVACTQGLGASIVTSIRGDNQFKEWFIYVLLGIVVITLLLELNYLNKALELFDSSMVVPTYFVTFTTATLVSSTILAQGFAAGITQLLSLVAGFLVICCGITLLQLSKVDPKVLGETVLDRKSTILLRASRSGVHRDSNMEKGLEIEDPGIDTLRGGFGAFGSIHRAISSRRSMQSGFVDPYEMEVTRRRNLGNDDDEEGEGDERLTSTVRHQLYDAPMPRDALDKISLHSNPPSPNPAGRPRGTTISFAQENDGLNHEHDIASTQNHSRFSEYSTKGSLSDGDEITLRSSMSGQGNSTTGGGPLLATMFTSPFTTTSSSSSTDPFDPSTGSTTSPTSTKRFHIPGFRSSSPARNHRDPIRRGPRDLDANETRGLTAQEEEEEAEEEYRHSRLPSRGSFDE